MTPIEIKVEGGLSVAIIFMENITTAMLSGVRKKMKEEVDELVPENFHFLSRWGPPIGRLQETKMALTEAFHEGNILMLRETSSSQNPKRKATEVEEAERYVDVDILVPPAGKVGKAPEGAATSVPSETKDVLPSTSTEGKKPQAKRPVQQTLTSMFGAKSSPKATRYATASVRKGVHIYSDQDILRSSGTERGRRKWWNEKAKQLCEDPQHDLLRGEAIDQKLHEEWRIHKASKMLEQERGTRQAIEELMQEYPDLKAFLESKKKMKQETLTRNVTRLDLALKTMTRAVTRCKS